MIQVGKRYYFIAHAYFHYIGDVAGILGVRRVSLFNVVQVHSHPTNWTQFFKKGFTSGTKFDRIGSSPDLGYIAAFDFPHPVPEPA